LAKQENIRATGVVVKALPNAHFIVQIIDEGFEGHEINAHISGKMRLNYIKILPGDHVIVELTPFDLSKGRIVYRGKEMKGAAAPQPEVAVESEVSPEDTAEDTSESPSEGLDTEESVQ